MNNIIIEKNNYVYKNKIYEYSEIESLINKCGKNIRIIVLEENLLIKIYEKVASNTGKDIEKNILDNLIIDEDTLLDYFFDKKLKKLYIYSIKQGIKVSKISTKANKIKIEPIQYVLKGVIKKKFKFKKDYKALIKINNYLYFISVESEKLVSSKTLEEKGDNLYNLIKEDLIGVGLLVDINLKDLIERISDDEQLKNIKFINLKEKVDYEISKIQRFFTQ